MSTRGDSRPDFEEFVVVCSDRLLRTAFLLTRDPALAEDLLQTALAKAWFAWNRLDAQPEPYVRRVLVNTYATWWRRRWHGKRDGEALPERTRGDDAAAATEDLWVALGRLSRRQRALVVLRCFDDLSEVDTAEALGCSPATVESQTAKALARLGRDATPMTGRGPSPRRPQAGRGQGDGVGTDELREALAEQATRVDALEARERLAAVDGRVAVTRRRHRASVALTVGLASVAAVVGLTVVRPLTSVGPDGPLPQPVVPSRSSQNLVELPPRLLGRQLPPTLRVNDVDYEYYRSETTQAGRDLLRVAVPSDRQPQALAWVSPATLSGQVVVSVDGQVVSRGRAGHFGSGLLVSAGRPHLVVVRATRPDASTRLGLAIYRWPQP